MRTYKVKRTLSSLLFIISAILGPGALYVIKFDLFNKFQEYTIWFRITSISIIVMLTLVAVLYRFTKFRFTNLQYGTTKVILAILIGILPSWTLFGLIWATKYFLETFYFIFGWLAVFQTFAFGICMPLIMKYDYLINKQIRKEEMIEAFKEAGRL